MKITEELLEAGRSSKGGWSANQWRSLGVKSFKGGWRKRLIGSYTTIERYEKFLSLKDEHFKNKGNFTSFRKPVVKTKLKHKNNLKSEYLDDRWLALRKKVLKRDNFTCLICKRSGRKNHVHHWRYQDGPVWETDIMFLATVCDECHRKLHSAISVGDL